ncbi:TRAP transporter substrate-binding protein DctP [Halomonas sp. MCCC 1A11062]|uniref:TRAP transporter substrate-binding protein n=1 Tax=Halomonas sp. MCCC 1A11062 TaxID=2733485 RepID=UPI001F1FB4CD|nr:TRAP transporter substrate-binding protein DctP [Halomonas sp. MCCC 1A11062]MCE8038962.1 TRAP transporter substrate-binding protein DctP [Halomonas sp. MCCC 1A11062]
MKKLSIVAAVSVAVGLSGVATAQANSYQMLVPFPTNHALNDIAHLFVEMVDEKFDGRYQIRLVGEDAIPGFEQFDPVSSGVFPMALSTGPYHTGVTGVGLAADAIDADPQARRESGIWEAYQDYYLTHNVRMISFPSANPGYHFMLTDPIGDDGGCEGRIIRGTLTYHGPIRAFGGSPAVMPVSEIYTAAERGVIEGAGHNIFGNYQIGLHEVLPYLVRPGFGVTSLMVVFNEDYWAEIPEEDQAAFLEIGRELEDVSLAHYDGLIAEETELMEGVGAELTYLGEEQQQMLDQAFADGLWEEAIRISGEPAESMRELAREAGLTP